MSLKPSQALLAALVLAAGPAFAQDAVPAAPTETPAAEQPAEAPAPDMDAAQAASDDAPVATPDEAAAPETAPDETGAQTATPDEATPADAPAAAVDAERPGSYYPKSEHGDWTIRCIRAGEGKDPCEMYKLLTDEDDNAVAELTLIPLSNGNVAAGATLVAPLETDLIEGLGFQVNGGEMRGYPFSFCAPVGCVSRLGFTEAELNSLKRGREAAVQLMPFGGDPQNPVRLVMSLTGFTAAFDELTAYAAEPAPEPAEADTGADAEEAAPAE